MIKKIKEILEFLYDGNDLTSQIIITPALENIFNSNAYLEIYDLEEYKNKESESSKKK